MREGIYFSFDNSSDAYNSGPAPLCTGFTVHFFKGLILKPFTSCTLAWVISEAMCLKSNAHLTDTDEIALFECKQVTL